MSALRLLPLSTILLLCSACANVYYDTMESVGIHKRDILVDRVESARDAQGDAQEQFKSALQQFASVIHLEASDLKQAYEQLNDEYEACESAAGTVRSRIEKVESVADALFEEWRQELDLYQNQNLKTASGKKLKQTQSRYQEMLGSMRRAERSMQPVLDSLRDNVLFLKHNLNAQAIGALRGEFSNLKADIDTLVKRMNQSIERSNSFIKNMQAG
jgi:septation ring formation regulator EzrA